MLQHRIFTLFACALLLISGLSVAAPHTTDVDFSSQYERVFQIRVVSPDAGSKSAIGSGFQVTADGLLITNYHVVSDYINSPHDFVIQYMSHDGRLGNLELVDFDVVSDLAVLQHPQPDSEYFQLADTPPAKGEVVYALGNPSDWGIVLVPGPANGMVEHSYEERVLFSGSLNSGMSGGPSLNREGDIIGVNVATAGSQLSFLVPVEKVSRLVNRKRRLNVDSYPAEIASQLKQWQRPRIDELLNTEWQTETFTNRELFGEIRKDFQCWGGTNDSHDSRIVERVSKTCAAGDDIYLGYSLSAGHIRFSFRNLKPLKLNRSQFARSVAVSMVADNNSGYKHSTNYECRKDFIDPPGDNSYRRIITCIRAFKKLPGLYDSLLMVQDHAGDQVFEAHLSLSALEPDQIEALNRQFVERAL